MTYIESRIGSAEIERRIGSTPQQRGSLSGQTCPDVFTLTDGYVAIIGDIRVTDEQMDGFPPELQARYRAGEEIIIVPRELMIDAKPDIPSV